MRTKMTFAFVWIIGVFVAQACGQPLYGEEDPIVNQEGREIIEPPGGEIDNEIEEILASQANYRSLYENASFLLMEDFSEIDRYSYGVDEHGYYGTHAGEYHMSIQGYERMRTYYIHEDMGTSFVGARVQVVRGEGEFVFGVFCHRDLQGYITLGISSGNYWEARLALPFPGEIIASGNFDYDRYFEEEEGEFLIEAYCAPNTYLLFVNGDLIAEVENEEGSRIEGRSGIFSFNLSEEISVFEFDDLLIIGFDE